MNYLLIFVIFLLFVLVRVITIKLKKKRDERIDLFIKNILSMVSKIEASHCTLTCQVPVERMMSIVSSNDDMLLLQSRLATQLEPFCAVFTTQVNIRTVSFIVTINKYTTSVTSFN